MKKRDGFHYLKIIILDIVYAIYIIDLREGFVDVIKNRFRIPILT
ncbi:hypothetical protein [Niallia sp.]|nr:hypothetical protein [Niallia sp.]